MRLLIPTGLTALLASFEQALIACHFHEQQAHLSASFMARLEPTQARLAELAEAHAVQKRDWALALQERRVHQERLRRLVRDAWIMLKRRDQRGQHGGLLLACFRMPQLAPQHESALVWLEHARNLVAGERLALQAGHAAMAFPSVVELEDCLAAASQAETVYGEHQQALKLIEVSLREQQRKAAHTLRCLAARLRESQFDERPEQARALLRSFGFQFKAPRHSPGIATQALAPEAEVRPLVPFEPRAAEPTTEPKPAQSKAEARPRWAAQLRGWVDGVVGLAGPARPVHKPEPEPEPGRLRLSR